MLEIGSVIDGKYKILNVVGKGGMSVVYLAMNERANKQWAIKEVRKDGMQSFEVVKQNLVAETDLLKNLIIRICQVLLMLSTVTIHSLSLWIISRVIRSARLLKRAALKIRTMLLSGLNSCAMFLDIFIQENPDYLP